MKEDNKIDINSKEYIKWRNLSERIVKNGIVYWVLEGDLYTNEEMFNQYKRYKHHD